MHDDLQMTPEAMLDLARRTAELVVERTGKLPEENAWDGEFRQILAGQLMQSPPENGRPAMEVIGQAARDILPFTTRLARVFWEDPAFISSTSLQGKFSLRLCIINHNTSWDDVRETLEAVEQFGAEALSQREG